MRSPTCWDTMPEARSSSLCSGRAGSEVRRRVMGLTVDDTIPFFHHFRRYYDESGDVREAVRQTLITSGRAGLFTTLVLVTGFRLFMLATLNNVFHFGLLPGVTMILALPADFLLAPALLLLVTRTSYGHTFTERWSGAPARA